MAAFSTRAHGLLDYLIAAVLATSPWWAGFAGSNPETWAAVGVAVVIVGNAFLTDHELGLIRRIQMPLHLWIDGIAAVVLGSSPWVLSFDQRVWLPHVSLAALLLMLAITSNTIPGYERRGAARAGVD